jgi:hypothetical protein
MYKKSILSWGFFLAFLFSFTAQLRADEGMWLLALLKKQNAEQLKAMGLKVPLDKLSGTADGALSESVIAFGSGCTGSVISNEGLVLTNYHCSYDAIQQYVTPTTDIYKSGYWASNQTQELPVKGLSVTINKKILDITAEVNGLLKAEASSAAHANVLTAISKKYQVKYPSYKVVIKSYKHNSIFVLFLQLRYDDVRMVGVPPKIVAKFGGETDNWMWPRQSADFAYFRIYTNKNGLPAAFSKTNIPLQVKNWLHISTEGYNKDDFAMSMGYPGFSDRNALSFKIKEKTQVLNPPLISVRKVVQSIWEDEMNKDPFVKQTYAEKFATSANYYKNAIGMNSWVNKLNIIPRMENEEKEWMNWAMQDTAKKELYATALQDMKSETEGKAALLRAQTYYLECMEACEVLRFNVGFGGSFNTYVTELKKRPSLRVDLSNTIRYHFKRLNPIVDKRITKAMLKLLKDSLPEQLLPDIFTSKNLHSNESIDQYVDEVFKTSTFADSTKLQNWLKTPSISLTNDPITELNSSIEKRRRTLFGVFNSTQRFYKNKIAYENSVAEFKGNTYYPDADKTIRLSYGTISDLSLEGKTIPYQTVFSSLIAKADTVNKDFMLHKKLLAIWENKDFGKYGVNGDMPVNFITNGDVTGGNSGSPMLNADGAIIGLVFDCNWESMTREFNYEKALHKVICVDIRYVLLITEKFSGSKRIVDEIEKANSLSRLLK